MKQAFVVDAHQDFRHVGRRNASPSEKAPKQALRCEGPARKTAALARAAEHLLDDVILVDDESRTKLDDLCHLVGATAEACRISSTVTPGCGAGACPAPAGHLGACTTGYRLHHSIGQSCVSVARRSRRIVRPFVMESALGNSGRHR
jgi:hypothetical protein